MTTSLHFITWAFLQTFLDENFLGEAKMSRVPLVNRNITWVSALVSVDVTQVSLNTAPGS